ncbi:TIGR00156 family protein [Deltaproteobacteria bacterium Smac51]|nr:TIGR00156 family protein [Deltaproteobacteria bacterium Smac51]
MKNLMIALVAAMIFCFASVALADGNKGGGFTGPNGTVATVAEAKKMADDTPVTLVGRIDKRLGGDKYEFRDDTGTITVEIDNDDWNGVTVGPNDIVEISGEVDKDLTSLEIDVDRVVKR